MLTCLLHERGARLVFLAFHGPHQHRHALADLPVSTLPTLALRGFFGAAIQEEKLRGIKGSKRWRSHGTTWPCFDKNG